jgi:protein-disulfide isomerase
MSRLLGGAVFSSAPLILGIMLAGAPAAAGAPATEPLAEVNGEIITTEEFQRALGMKLSHLEEQIHEIKRKEIDALVTQKLLTQEAAKRGISVEALLDAEVTTKVGPVTEAEVEAFYQGNKARLSGEEAAVRQNIRTQLQEQRITIRRLLFLDSLRSRAKVVMRLPPPPLTRIDVSNHEGPYRGNAQAPVTIVEFSDFKCPFCSRAQPTLKQVLERYRGKVKLVYRDFPLEAIHPEARRAAEAARCAHDQEKFWPYHDLLFSHFPQVGLEDLRQYANQAGLDAVRFEKCLTEGTHRETIQRDIDEAKRLGVAGTPAFFINGRPLSGAQPIDAFVRIIDEELARAPIAIVP